MQKGFTLIELVIAMTIFFVMMALAIPNLLGSRSQAEINSAVPVLISDIKNQQLKAMLGATEGRATTDYYGVHFETNTYTLFHGLSYNPVDTSNAIVSLSGTLKFGSIAFSNAQIIFQKGNGEVVGFNSVANTVVLIDPSNNESRTITLNSYGTITGVQ